MGAEQSAPAGAPLDSEAAVPIVPKQNTGSGEGDAVAPSGSQQIPKALVIVGPSGVGKGTLINRLRQGEGHDMFGFSVSHTTRQPRVGEKHGEHYYFTTKEQFAKEVGEGKFLEYAEVHNNLYGTSVRAVESVLESGRVCILDIDVQGARSVHASGLPAIFVFIAPPSLEDLAKRLAGRGTETVEQIKRRLDNAKHEIESLNERPSLYDYLLVNDNLEECLHRLRGIAARAAAGLDAEPGQVPERVMLEDAPLPTLPTPQESTTSTSTTQVPLQQRAKATSTGAAHGSECEPSLAGIDTVLSSGIRTGMANGGTGDDAAPSQQWPEPGLSAHQQPEVYQQPLHSGLLDRWLGKVALVTGASSGIGRETCEALALAGMHVVAVARRKDRLEQLQLHMHNIGIPQSAFLPIVCDITKETEVVMLPRIVAKRWPGSGIDVLVNNAGLSRDDASLFEGSVTSWVEMLSTNVLGTCLCTKAVLQDMQARGSYGHIINMVGLSGHRIPDGPQGGGFYCATKAAVKVITEGLRQEARGRRLPLRVSGISPGMVETEFFSVRAFGDEAAAKRATSAIKCLQPEDIAQAIIWCLSAPDHVEVNDIVIRPTEQMV